MASANLKLARHCSSYGKWRFRKRSTTFGWMSSRFQDRTFYCYTRFTSLRASKEISPLCVAKIERAIAISAQEKKNIIWGIEKRSPKPVWVQSLIGSQEWPKPWTPSLLQRVWVFYASLQVASCKSRNLSLGMVNRFKEKFNGLPANVPVYAVAVSSFIIIQRYSSKKHKLFPIVSACFLPSSIFYGP